MFRAVQMGNKVYVVKIDLEDDIENIESLVSSGDVVILCSDIEDLEDYIDTDIYDIELVE